MCDTKFKELHMIFYFFWLFCVFHTCILSLVLPSCTRLSVGVGLAVGFTSSLRFWPLEGAVSNGKRLTVEWTLARRRWCFITRDLHSAAAHISHSGVEETNISRQECTCCFDIYMIYAVYMFRKHYRPIGFILIIIFQVSLNCLTDVIFTLMGPQCQSSWHWLLMVSAKMFCCSLNNACFHFSSCMIYHSGPEPGLFSSRIRYQIAPVHSQCIYPCLDIKQT